mmetsp:Transcript_20968/g.62546  ORF Transcript_20968/g.62546 Transcript_20968/m.62546 type:complete len:350 (-) Transcript_20968:1029-2078(-)
MSLNHVPRRDARLRREAIVLDGRHARALAQRLLLPLLPLAPAARAADEVRLPVALEALRGVREAHLQDQRLDREVQHHLAAWRRVHAAARAVDVARAHPAKPPPAALALHPVVARVRRVQPVGVLHLHHAAVGHRVLVVRRLELAPREVDAHGLGHLKRGERAARDDDDLLVPLPHVRKVFTVGRRRIDVGRRRRHVYEAQHDLAVFERRLGGVEVRFPASVVSAEGARGCQRHECKQPSHGARSAVPYVSMRALAARHAHRSRELFVSRTCGGGPAMWAGGSAFCVRQAQAWRALPCLVGARRPGRTRRRPFCASVVLRGLVCASVVPRGLVWGRSKRRSDFETESLN